jgi:hypothetical protein
MTNSKFRSEQSQDALNPLKSCLCGNSTGDVWSTFPASGGGGEGVGFGAFVTSPSNPLSACREGENAKADSLGKLTANDARNQCSPGRVLTADNRD